MSSTQAVRQHPAGLSEEELQRMFQNAIRLTNDNKINNNNAWDIPLISHMPDIIKLTDQQQGPNFQRAGSALEAGTLIYSKRVDSTYNSTYQMLQGFGAAVAAQADLDAEGDDVAGQSDQDAGGGGEGGGKRADAARKARARAADVDPAGTLASVESLRAKRADTTFENDPLFCRTTKLFDQSSAAGLLLLNYSVHKRTHVLFEGSEQPLSQLPLTRDPALDRPDKQLDARLLSDLSACLDKCAAQPMTPSITSLQQELHSAAAGRAGAPPVLDNAAMLRAALGSKYIVPGAAPPTWQRASQAAAGRCPVSLAGEAGGDGGDEAGAGAASQQAGWQSAGGDADVDGGAGFVDAGGPGDDAVGGGGLDEGTWGVRAEGAQADWPSEDLSGDVMGLGGGYGDDGGGGDDDEEEQDEAGATAAYDQDSLLGLTSMTGVASTGARAAAGKASGWAGLAFWRAGAQGKRTGGTTTKRTTKRKVSVQVTGDAGPDELRPTGTHNDVRLKRTTATTTLLPEDVHYEASWLQCLSGSSGPDRSRVSAHAVFKLVLEQWSACERRSRAQQQHNLPAGATATQGGGGGDDGGGSGGWGDDDGFEDENAGGWDQPGGLHDEVPGQFGSGPAWEVDVGDSRARGAGEAEEADAEEEQEVDAGVAALLSQLTLEGVQAPPRKVAPPKIAFDQSAKQVDVKALKENIDLKLQGLAGQRGTRDMPAPPVPVTFHQVLHDLPVAGIGGVGEGGRGVSVHLAFICLLHLANEKGLYLGNTGNLDQLNIKLPAKQGGVATA